RTTKRVRELRMEHSRRRVRARLGGFLSLSVPQRRTHYLRWIQHRWAGGRERIVTAPSSDGGCGCCVTRGIARFRSESLRGPQQDPCSFGAFENATAAICKRGNRSL